jgi:hypothetical protein
MTRDYATAMIASCDRLPVVLELLRAVAISELNEQPTKPSCETAG